MPKQTQQDNPTTPAVSDADSEMAKFLVYMEERAADQQSIGARVLTVAADNLAAIFEAGGGEAEKAADYLNVPLLVQGADFLPSDFADQENSYSTFLVLTAATTDGQSHKITVGAATVMQQVYKLIVGGHLPCAVIIRKVEKATKGGFHPFYLVDGSAEWEKGF